MDESVKTGQNTAEVEAIGQTCEGCSEHVRFEIGDVCTHDYLLKWRFIDIDKPTPEWCPLREARHA